MSNIVEYILKINSQISGLTAATKAANETNAALQRAQNTSMGFGKVFGQMKGVLTTVGIGVGMYQVVDMMRQGVEKAHELHQAQAQIRAGIISTNGAAGMTMETIENSAKKISSASLYGRSDLLKMQSVLLTFPKVTSNIFDSASQSIADMSTRMGLDLPHAAVMVGKALQDPISGVMMMRRIGVNFTKDQVAGFKKLVQAGKLHEAQLLILKELNTEFGGSAKAAFDAEPLAKYNKAVNSIKIELGEFAVKIQEKLAPHLESLAGKFKTVIKDSIDFVKWMNRNRDVALSFGVALIGLYTALNIVSIQSKLALFWQGLLATKTLLYTISIMSQIAALYLWDVANAVACGTMSLLTAATTAFGIALQLTGIPGIVIAITALIGAVIWAFNTFGWFRGSIYAAWEALKGLGNLVMNFIVDSIGNLLKGIGGVGDALIKLFSGDFKGALATGKQAFNDLLNVSAFDNAKNNWNQAGKNIAAAYQQGINEIATKDALGTINDPKIKLGMLHKKQIEDLIKQYKKLDGLKGDKYVNQRMALAGKMNAIRSGVFSVVNDQNFNGINDAKETPGGKATKNGIDGVATGGTRNTTINIHLGKMIENIIFQGGLKENAQDMERQVEEVLMRVLFAAESAS